MPVGSRVHPCNGFLLTVCIKQTVFVQEQVVMLMLIWFVIIISTVVLYCLMKVKAESDELYEELMRKHFMVDWMIFLHLTKLST